MHKLKKVVVRFTLAGAVAAMPLTMLGQTNSTPSSDSTMGSNTMNSNSMGGNLSAADKKFVRDAAQGGMAEVEFGKLATEKASSEEVKKFGQRMVDDHSKANDELKQVASSQGINLPDKLSAKDEMTKERLSKLSGPEFDKVYMSDMVKDHTQDVADFKRESNSGKDSAVKNFAATTLPTLESHLREAKKIAPTTGSGNAMKSGAE